MKQIVMKKFETKNWDFLKIITIFGTSGVSELLHRQVRSWFFSLNYSFISMKMSIEIFMHQIKRTDMKNIETCQNFKRSLMVLQHQELKNKKKNKCSEHFSSKRALWIETCMRKIMPAMKSHKGDLRVWRRELINMNKTFSIFALD